MNFFIIFTPEMFIISITTEIFPLALSMITFLQVIEQIPRMDFFIG